MKQALKSIFCIILSIFVLLISGPLSVLADTEKALYGDTDGDGLITVRDARYIHRAVSELEAQSDIMDIDQDGVIAIADARYALRGSLGLDNYGSWGFKVPDTIPARKTNKIRLESSLNKDEITVSVFVRNPENLIGAEMVFSYDPNTLNFRSVKENGAAISWIEYDETYNHSVIFGRNLNSKEGILSLNTYAISDFGTDCKWDNSEEIELLRLTFTVRDYITEPHTQISAEAKLFTNSTELYSKETINAPVHEYLSIIEEKDSTCIQHGHTYYSCKCGGWHSEVKPLAEHTDTDKNGYCDVCCIDINSKINLQLGLIDNNDDYTTFVVMTQNAAQLRDCIINIEYDSAVYAGCEFTNEGAGFREQQKINVIETSLDHHTRGTIKISYDFYDNITLQEPLVLFVIRLARNNNKSGSDITLKCNNDTVKLHIPATHTHNYTTFTKYPTCINEGWVRYTCECGDSYTETLPVSSNHFWGKWKITKLPDYENTGVAERICEDCKQKENKTIEKIDKNKINPLQHIAKAMETNITVLPGTAIGEVFYNPDSNVTITDKDNKAVSADTPVKSGMTITLRDANGKVIDTKTIVVPGDNDGDGVISASDARAALRASVKLDSLNEWQKAASNLDNVKEDVISASDARYILRASVKLEDIAAFFEKL